MIIINILILWTLVLCGLSKKIRDDEFGPQPKIVVENGHLRITVPQQKNIHFKASKMTINDMDLLSTLTMANNATTLLSTYQNSFASYVTRINDLESRLLTFEPETRNTINTSTNGSIDLNLQNSIRRINRRITAIQRGLNRLNMLLLTNECASNPCKNGGTCTDMFNGFWCKCTLGWEGSTCENDVNECSRFAGTDLGCQNGATCVNKLGTYECLCQRGWFGLHCTRKTVDCNTGGAELCGHGTCISQNNEDGYKCICDQGWTTDGTHWACNTDVDECKLNHPPCSVNPMVPCINVPGSFYCGSCPQGYTGNGYYCTDIDECALFNGGCSTSPMVQCINTPGSKICGPCPPGYFGDGTTCSFRGVCNVNNGGCHPSAQCRNNPSISSTYTECICPPGMVGNGMGPDGCRPQSGSDNPCSPNPCLNGDCAVTNTSTNYVCHCRTKYTGRNCEIYKDPCSPNPCLNAGTCTAVLGTVTFRCQCQTGFSGRRCQTERAGCGGSTKSENGTITYPTSDFEEQTPNGFSCAWVIETSPQKVLHVKFKKFNVGNSGTCRNSWVQIHDGRNTMARLLGRFCGTQLPLGGNLVSTDNVLYLWFKSARNTNAEIELNWTSNTPTCGGLIMTRHAKYGKIESPGSPGNYPNNRDCSWTLLAAPGKRFLFHFYQLSIGNNSDCTRDYLKFETSSPYFEHSRDLAQFCNSSLPPPLYSIDSLVRIRFHSDSQDNYPGFQLTYALVEGIPGCGGVYTDIKGVIQSVSTETITHHKDITCEYEIRLPKEAKIKLTFLEFDIQADDGCDRNNLKIYEGSSQNSPLIGTYCGNKLPGPYISLTNLLTLISKTTKPTNKWKIQYETICVIKMTESNGSITAMPASSRCTYIIDQPIGYQIILTMKLKFFPANTTCYDEYVEVRDGNSESSALIGRYCGRKTVSLQSSHNGLWIKLNKYLYSRFQADYTTINIGCGGILTDKIGTIAFPAEGSKEYPSQKTCRWLIMAPPKNVIQITWMTFNVEQSIGCSYDNIQIFDNGTEGMGGLMGKFCGYTLPPLLLSSSNIMTVVFQSDNSVNGEGFLASYTFLPENNVCGGNYFTPAGVIKSPGYPDPYPINRECKWTITVEPGRQILLNITDFDIESYASCRYDWLEIRNGGTSASPLIGKFCGTNIPTKLIPSHANKIYLSFNSDTSRSGRGFKIIWTSTATGCGGTLASPTGSIISPHYPEPYSRSTDCLWKISVSSGSKVQVIFADIDLERHVFCGMDYVEIFDGSTKNSKSLGRYCRPVLGPIRTSKNNMLVRFRSDVSFQGRGFNLQYSTVCRNTLRGFRGVIESPNFPNEYPQDQNCLWEIIVPSKNKINITFSHFQLERSVTLQNKSCAFDYVEIQYSVSNEEIYEENELSYEKYGRYCGDDNPGLITLDSDHAKILFVSDSLLLGSGFRLEWQLFGCGGILNHKSGTIRSPNYPKSYPPYIHCHWLIQVDFGNSIEITFTEMDVESGYNCDYDSVQVFNGIDETYNLLSKICHQTKPTTITSTGNSMFIQFKSDNSYQGKGFVANYSTVQTKCGGKLIAPEGNIFSPNYPKNYNKNDTCEWLIEIDENHVINIEFDDVDLLTTSGCTQNYVKVFDGPSQAYPLLATVCGSTKPNSTITSSYNYVLVEFRSHAYFATKGFHLKYKKACGAKIKTQGSGTIELSRHYDFTVLDPNCTWTIEALNPSDHIALTISHMDGGSMDCDYVPFGIDSKPVKIYNGEFTDSPLLGSYCGHKIPPTLFSDGSVMHININSAMDFFATYTVLDSQCGGTLISQDGYFSTPGYPKRYQLNTKCEWTIAMAPGNHLTLNFINFDLPESDNCNTDYLEIRKTNASGLLLGVYCGQNGPVNITHTGSLWILFKSSNLTVVNTESISKGFYAEYILSNSNALEGSSGQIASPLYPRQFFGQQMFSWSIKVAPGHAVLITFKEFYVEMDAFEDDECYSTSLSIYDGPDNTYERLGSFCGIVIPSPVKSKSNVVTVQLDNYAIRSGTKFLLEWNEVDREVTKPTSAKSTVPGCGSTEIIDISTIKKVNITSPGYPNGSPSNLHCEWVVSTISMNHLRFRMIHIDLQPFYIMYTSTCFSEYVEIFKKEVGKDWESVKRICREDDIQAINLPSLAKIVFNVKSARNGTGFRAEIEQVCGGFLTEPSGYIIFNNDTEKGYACQWNITVRPGRRIELTFEKMNIPSSKSTSCDNYLLIRNGKFPDSPFLGNGKYCGNQKPEKLKSTSNNLYLKYSGFSEIEGFQIKYQEVSVQCGGDIQLATFDNSTEISSPNYPNIPDAHSECTWIIRAPSGESLQIDFEERFDLTKSVSCEKEYVEVRDGGTEYSPLINRFCESVPSTQFTTDNIMFVRFFTDVEEPKNGFKAKISIATCGGTVRSESGQITSPDIKTFPVICTWRIVGPIHHYLILSFAKLHLSTANNCSNTPNYISLTEANKVIANDTNDLGLYCGTKVPSEEIKSMANEVIVTLTVASAFNFQGFALNFNSSQEDCGGKINQASGIIVSPGYHYLNNNTKRNCAWKIEVPEGRRIVMKFLEIDLDPYTLTQYLGIFNGHNYESKIISIINNQFEQYKMKTIRSSSNKVLIYFWYPKYTTHKGFKLEFSSNEPSVCIGDFNQANGVISQPESNVDFMCEWQHMTLHKNQTFAITLNINTNFSSKGSSCRHSRISLSVTDTKKQILAMLCRSMIRPVTVRSPFPITILKARTDTRYALNFTASYNTYNCGGMLDSETGYITSPNFPNKPMKTTECVWLLILPSEQAIKINFVDINLGSDCEKSFLSVNNGDLPTSPKIGKYCQNNKPESFVSQANKVWIEYKYEQGSDGNGFNLTYEPIINGCGGVFHDKTRIIQTPGYSNDYPDNIECFWEIRSLTGYFIRLTFIDRFYIEQSNNCTNDYLEMWDWKDDMQTWVSLGRKCGRVTPDSLNSTSNRFKLLFRSNDKITGTGFKAKWDWHCGGTFETSSNPQYITSPGYPDTYKSNLRCVYEIKTKETIVILKFDDFELEDGVPKCKYDNVTIRRPYPIRSQLLYSNNVFCGSNTPPLIRTRGSVTVEFNSDKYLWGNGRGFKFQYFHEKCGGEITNASVIESRWDNSRLISIGTTFQPFIECTWKITAPPNQVVAFVIDSLRSGQTRLCFGQALHVYDGLVFDIKKKLATLCGNINQSAPIMSQSNTMMIKIMANPTNYRGFKGFVYFTYGPSAGCGGVVNLTETKTIESPNNLTDLDCAWKIIAPMDYQVKIDFTSINVPAHCGDNYKNISSVFCRCAFIEIRDGGGPMSDLISKLCSNVHTETFTTSWNTAYIRMFASGTHNNVFKATLTPVKSVCGNSIISVNSTRQVLTSPNYPNSYPDNIKCTWRLEAAMYSYTIAIHFDDFDLADEESYKDLNICEQDRFEIIEDSNSHVITEGLGPSAVYNGNPHRFVTYSAVSNRHAFCGKNDIPFDYYSRSKSLILTFKSAPGSVNRGKGFKLEYSLSGCNRNYTSLQGRVVSGERLAEGNCYINISVPQNHTISLYFIKFSLVNSPDCDKVGLEVKEQNSTGLQLLKVCGTRLPDSVFSSTNTLWVHFYAKYRLGMYTRFDFVYTSSDNGRGCGGQFYNYQGRFTSPLYPNSYPKQSVCMWDIRVPTGLIAALKFNSFDIKGDCSENKVVVETYIGASASSHQFCPMDNPNSVLFSSNNHIKVTYHSSPLNTGMGWVAVFQGVTEVTKDEIWFTTQ